MLPLVRELVLLCWTMSVVLAVRQHYCPAQVMDSIFTTVATMKMQVLAVQVSNTCCTHKLVTGDIMEC